MRALSLWGVTLQDCVRTLASQPFGLGRTPPAASSQVCPPSGPAVPIGGAKSHLELRACHRGHTTAEGRRSFPPSHRPAAMRSKVNTHTSHSEPSFAVVFLSSPTTVQDPALRGRGPSFAARLQPLALNQPASAWPNPQEEQTLRRVQDPLPRRGGPLVLEGLLPQGTGESRRARIPQMPGWTRTE